MSNIISIIGVVLLVLALVFYFANIATGSLMLLVIAGVLLIVVGLLARGRL